MSLSNPNLPVTEQRLQEFYHKLLPYMGGGGTGGGHTIEDSEGTDLTQRDTLQFGEGFKAEDDDTNEKTVISPDVMQSGDMDDVISVLPSVAPKKEGIKYSTTEQVIGEWIDGKPIYQKTLSITMPANGAISIDTTSLNIASLIDAKGWHESNDYSGLIPTPVNGGKACFIFYNKGNGQIYLYNDFTDYGGRNGYLTIQYTKTTDTPNT